MTTKQQRQDFIDHVRGSAKALFLPPAILDDGEDFSVLHHMWLHNVQRTLIGTSMRHPSTGEIRFSNGPSSMAALASNIELFDDLADRPEGLEVGQGYTDGASLFVPLSKFKALIKNPDPQSAAAWIDEGLRVHAGHLVGQDEFHNPSWRVLDRPVYPPARSSMIYALSKANVSAGPWLSAWGKAVHESKEDATHLAINGQSKLTKIFHAIQEKSYALVGAREDNSKPVGASASRVPKGLPTKSEHQAASQRQKEAVGWFMETYRDLGLRQIDFSLAVSICRTAFSGDVHPLLAGSLGDMFFNSLAERPEMSSAMTSIAKKALVNHEFVSSLFPGSFKQSQIYMSAQSCLLDPDVSARALAEAILHLQELVPKSAQPGDMNHQELMNTLPLLTKGSNMSIDLLFKAAKHAPHVAIQWASRNLSKLRNADSLIVRNISSALVENKMGYSDDERIEIIKQFIDLDGGRIYELLHPKELFRNTPGFHEVLLSQQSWAANAMTEVLKRYPGEAPAVVYYWNDIINPIEGNEENFDMPSIMFDAGLTPDTLISHEKNGSNKKALRAWDQRGEIDRAFSEYQAKKIQAATPEVDGARRSIRL